MPAEPKPFRVSRFMNFNTGEVFLDPELLATMQVDNPWSLKQEIDFFQCRIEVWQFGPAVEMLKQIEVNDPPSAWCHAAYGMLFILTPYFEMIGKILRPGAVQWRHGEQDFACGFCNVYPTLPLAQPEPGVAIDFTDPGTLPHVTNICDLMRNGLFHLGFTKRNFLIHNEDTYAHDFELQPIADRVAGVGDAYLMKPHQVTRTIVDHFAMFVEELRQPANKDIQARFVKFVGEFHNPNKKKGLTGDSLDQAASSRLRLGHDGSSPR